MKILITGSKGFIGSHLGNYLQSKDHDITGLDNNSHPCGQPTKFTTVHGDVRFYDEVDKWVGKADLVYHLAAQINVDRSIENPKQTLDVNLVGTYNVLEACKKYNVPMVFASTSEVYGGHDEPINEGSDTRSQSPYATSKLAADKLCGNYHDLYGLEVYRARFFNVFGEWQNDDDCGAVIPRFTSQVLSGIRPTIYGDGSQSRDYIHIDDVVRAYELLPTLKKLNGEPVNIGTGETHTIKNIAELIIHYAESNLEPDFWDARPGEVSKLLADTSLISSFGFLPAIKFNDGLRRYVLWKK
ncbi:MAG: dTDP-glucose 4,6-dehydratase [Elusimicrobia bacterium]|nr:dTDP-glucose 4,6-dehydratase [Elusimicrobiota bacterium]